MTALVVGAARSGIALTNYLTRAGETVRVFDRKPARELRDAISEMDRGSIAEAFQQDETSQTSCMRWMLRGLDCKKAIRKVQLIRKKG